jgi:hypothetical protein
MDSYADMSAFGNEKSLTYNPIFTNDGEEATQSQNLELMSAFGNATGLKLF